VPTPAATRVAVTLAAAHHTALFTYERGATMVGLTAPARRVGFAVNEEEVVRFNGNAWSIFDAAVAWLRGAR
jgi:hypothetical protein